MGIVEPLGGATVLLTLEDCGCLSDCSSKCVSTSACLSGGLSLCLSRSTCGGVTVMDVGVCFGRM